MAYAQAEQKDRGSTVLALAVQSATEVPREDKAKKTLPEHP